MELLRRGRRERLAPPAQGPGFEIIEEDWPPAQLERARAVVAGTETSLLD